MNEGKEIDQENREREYRRNTRVMIIINKQISRMTFRLYSCVYAVTVNLYPCVIAFPC